jgi:hypothetical protein
LRDNKGSFGNFTQVGAPTIAPEPVIETGFPIIAAPVSAWNDSDTGNETLLLNFNGTDGSTTLTDDTGLNTLTAYGNAQLDTALKKFGTASLLLDGAGDYIECPYNTSRFDWWTADYTIDCWVYASSFADWSYVNGVITPLLIGNNGATVGSNYWSFGPVAGNALAFYYWNGAQNSIVSVNNVVPTDEWVHVALIINGNTIELYCNGLLVASGTISGTPQSGTAYGLTIGAGYNNYLTGSIDGLRITKGTKRYTYVPVANFTVPTSEPSA